RIRRLEACDTAGWKPALRLCHWPWGLTRRNSCACALVPGHQDAIKTLCHCGVGVLQSSGRAISVDGGGGNRRPSRANRILILKRVEFSGNGWHRNRESRTVSDRIEHRDISVQARQVGLEHVIDPGKEAADEHVPVGL